MTLKQMFAGLIVSISMVPLAVAQRLPINTGVHSDVPTIVAGIINVLLAWSGLVATALFLLGSILMVGSGGTETYLAAGKKIMKASLIGLVIVLSSWLILSTTVFFLAG